MWSGTKPNQEPQNQTKPKQTNQQAPNQTKSPKPNPAQPNPNQEAANQTKRVPRPHICHSSTPQLYTSAFLDTIPSDRTSGGWVGFGLVLGWVGFGLGG
jgi:hypothetical protein